MEHILQGLHDIEGVHGALVIDASGQLLAHRTHSIYDVELLEQVSRAVVGAIDAVKLVQEDWEAITTHFSEGKLLIRNASAADGKLPFTLTLVADGRLNPSFANVAIRVALGKLKTAMQAGGVGAGAPRPPDSAATAPAAAKAAPASSSDARAPLTEVASTGLSWSGVGSSMAASGSEVTVADAASSALLTACTKALARNVGPMAKLFVKEAARKVCPDRPFSRDSAEALVAELAKSIRNPSDAAQFQRSMLAAL